MPNVGIGLAASLLLLASAAAAQDMARLEQGMRIYKSDMADCEFCHGWSGTGRYHNVNFSHIQAGGPSLGMSKMNRAQMIEIVSCGKMTEVGIMPQYRGDAWTPQVRCFGKVAADMPDAERPLRGTRMLTPAQIEAVVDYIQAVYQGKTMTLEWCLKYFSAETRGCDLLR